MEVERNSKVIEVPAKHLLVREHLSEDVVAMMMRRIKDLSALYQPAVLRHYGNDKPLSYGELSPELVSKLLWQIKCSPEDRVVDIGSGVGNLCMQTSMEFGCASSVGIEVREDLHKVAADMCGVLQAETEREGLQRGEVELFLGDVRHPCKRFLEHLSRASIVIVNNVVFPSELDMYIFGLLKKKLQPGCKVVCFKDCFPRLRGSTYITSDHPLSAFHLPPHQFLSQPGTVSWTASPIRYFVYVVAPPAPLLQTAVVRGQLQVGKAALPEEIALAEEEQRVFDAWRERCEHLAFSAINREAFDENSNSSNNNNNSNSAKGKKEVKGKNKKKKARAPEQEEEEEEEEEAEVVVVGEELGESRRRSKREKRWAYVEEIPFILPPSPPRGRFRKGRGFQDTIQTKSLPSRNQKAIVRQRPKSPSPMRTRGQRQKMGKHVVELKKLVIWMEPLNPSHDDFCAVCLMDGFLMCCDGGCWRAFHLPCVGLEDVPEEDYVCSLCTASKEQASNVCAVCLVEGYTTLECRRCACAFHSDCVGRRFLDPDEEWLCEDCQTENSRRQEEKELPKVINLEEEEEEVV